jgi:predicted transcriptional regulator
MAQARHTVLSLEEIAEGLRIVVGVLQSLQEIEHGRTSNNDSGAPAMMSPLDSIQQQQVICLECHQSFQLLSGRHLALHGLTPRDYKRKYGLPLSQPLCARSFILVRQKLPRKKRMGTKMTSSQKMEKANSVRLRLVR